MASPVSHELIFLGTGVSTALPRLSCIMQRDDSPCAVCDRAHSDPLDPNCRSNVSVLVRRTETRQVEGMPEVSSRCLMIDAGKTMRDAALRWFPKHGVKSVDAVLVTHGHADAVGGMDELREFTSFIKEKGADRSKPKDRVALVKKGFFGLSKELPVYLNQETFEVCEGAYPYLVPKLKNDKVPRRVATVRWEVIDNAAPFEVLGMEILPLPVHHGGTYVCLGFSFGNGSFVYLSDVSEVQPHILETLKSFDIELLVLDCLDRGTSPSHYCLPDSLALVRELRPRKTLLVGMSCELGLHDDVNEELGRLKGEEGIDVQLARDGQSVQLGF